MIDAGDIALGECGYIVLNEQQVKNSDVMYAIGDIALYNNFI